MLLAFGAFWQRKALADPISTYLPIPIDMAEVVLPANESTATNDARISNGGNEDGESYKNFSYKDSNSSNVDEFTGTVPNEESSSKVSTLPHPRFAKITASFGPVDPPYEAAISTHNLHNDRHGYPHFILREPMLRGLWSKHSYILTILGTELSKPANERLQWLFWHDRDTVLMNPQIPLDIFVPPEPEFAHVHLIVTRDRNGLNNGVFMVRVGQWAFKLFASALSIMEYEPEVRLKYSEQSAMEEVIKRVRYSTRLHNPYPLHH